MEVILEHRMESNNLIEAQSISSIEEIEEGDGLYYEQNESSYWVKELTDTGIVLEDKEGETQELRREQFQTSLNQHSWILQSKGPTIDYEIPSDNEK